MPRPSSVTFGAQPIHGAVARAARFLAPALVASAAAWAIGPGETSLWFVAGDAAWSDPQSWSAEPEGPGGAGTPGAGSLAFVLVPTPGQLRIVRGAETGRSVLDRLEIGGPGNAEVLCDPGDELRATDIFVGADIEGGPRGEHRLVVQADGHLVAESIELGGPAVGTFLARLDLAGNVEADAIVVHPSAAVTQFAGERTVDSLQVAGLDDVVGGVLRAGSVAVSGVAQSAPGPSKFLRVLENGRLETPLIVGDVDSAVVLIGTVLGGVDPSSGEPFPALVRTEGSVNVRGSSLMMDVEILPTERFFGSNLQVLPGSVPARIDGSVVNGGVVLVETERTLIIASPATTEDALVNDRSVRVEGHLELERGRLSNRAGATVRGAGTIRGTIVNRGMISPGPLGIGTGEMVIDGALHATPESRIRMDVRGSSEGAFDTLRLIGDGAFVLEGELGFDRAPDYEPGPADRIRVIRWNVGTEVDVAFDDVVPYSGGALPSWVRLGYEVVDDGVEIVFRTCPEDIIPNGVVDGFDLVSLLNAWGTDSIPSDVDADGVVAMSDLLRVLAAFGPCE